MSAASRRARFGGGRCGAWALVLSAALGGCVHVAEAPIARTVGGARVPGPFVSPWSYEHFVRGELAMLAGDWARARAAYDAARAGAEDDPLLCARLADALDRLGDAAGADRAIAEGLALDPRSEAVLLEAGELALRRGDARAALARFADAMDAAPSSAAPVLALARLLEASATPDAAAAALARHPLASTSSVDPDARRRAEAALALALRREDAPGAASALAQAGPGARALVLEAATRALDEGRASLAAALLAGLPPRDEERALRLRVAVARAALDPAAREDALRWLATPTEHGVRASVEDGRAWLALGEPTLAREHADAALAEDPAASEASLLRGEAWLAEGRADLAAEAFASIAPGSSAFASSRAWLARALSAGGLPALGAEVEASPRSR